MTEATGTGLDALLKRLASAPERATGIALPLRDEAWERPVEGGWTRRQTLAHLATNDLRAMVRIRAALGEASRSELDAVNDIDGWNQAHIEARRNVGVEALLSEYRTNRRALTRLLSSLPAARIPSLTVDRAGRPEPLSAYLTRIDRHDDEHLSQIASPGGHEEGERDVR